MTVPQMSGVGSGSATEVQGGMSTTGMGTGQGAGTLGPGTGDRGGGYEYQRRSLRPGGERQGPGV